MNADFKNNIRKRVPVTEARYLESDNYVDPANDPKYRGGAFKRQSTLVDQYDVVQRAVANDAGVQSALATVVGTSSISGGAISDTTTAGGDVVVTHSMSGTPSSVIAVSSGTAANFVEIQAITSTTFTVRFYDDTGTAINAGAVTGYWIAIL